MAKVVYIDAPEALTRRQRTMGAVVTGVMWAAYAYLWLPLISLFAWGLGFELAYDAVIRAGGISALGTAAFWYSVMLADVIVTVAIWSQLNRWRFAGHNRRTKHPVVADEALAAHFGVRPEDLDTLRSSRRVELDLDALGRPVVHEETRGSSSRPEPRPVRANRA